MPAAGRTRLSSLLKQRFFPSQLQSSIFPDLQQRIVPVVAASSPRNPLSFTLFGTRANSSLAQVREVDDMAPQHAVKDGDLILYERSGSAGVAVLNRPRALNALNMPMVKGLQDLYEKWEEDPSVRMIILKAVGRAFCAGGDVRSVYDLASKGDMPSRLAASAFFRAEYELNYHIATLRRPHIALINGMVFGGGNGVSMHGPFRVVTENAVFAMPEVNLGLHPDVGASYFLPRLKGHLGEYLALTGTRLAAPDMVAVGLATHFVPSERLPQLERRLSQLQTSDLEAIHLAILEHSERVDPSPNGVVARAAAINACFSLHTLDTMLSALQRLADSAAPSPALTPASTTTTTTTTDPSSGNPTISDSSSHSHLFPAELATPENASWAAQTRTTLLGCSPTSLRATLRSIREGRQQSLARCLQREYRLSVRALMCTATNDLYEGIRARLVDKDGAPKWNPSSLSQVSSAKIDALFQPLDSLDEELSLAVSEREGKRQRRARL